MQFFFNKSIHAANVLAKDPTWNYAKACLERNLQITTSYYQSRGFAVRGNHLLVRLLNSIGVDHQLHIERYYDIVNAKTHKLAIHFKLTSPVYSGQLFDGVFYGAGTKEIIIADDEYISPYEIQKDWKSIQAVKVLDHPRSDLDLLLPNGKASSTETGIASIKINIAALAVQYREFLIEQMQKMQQGDNPSTTAFFIYRYVLPNMLPTHLDAALFNRIFNIMVGKPMGLSTVKHAFNLPDYTKYVDQVYYKLVNTIKHSDAEFWTTLRSIPLVSISNAQEFMRLPDLAPTRQLAWAEFLTRLKCINFLIASSESHGQKRNASDLNYLLRKIVYYSSDGIFRQIADAQTYADTIREVKDIVQLTQTGNYPVS